MAAEFITGQAKPISHEWQDQSHPHEYFLFRGGCQSFCSSCGIQRSDPTLSSRPCPAEHTGGCGRDIIGCAATGARDPACRGLADHSDARRISYRTHLYDTDGTHENGQPHSEPADRMAPVAPAGAAHCLGLSIHRKNLIVNRGSPVYCSTCSHPPYAAKDLFPPI